METKLCFKNIDQLLIIISLELLFNNIKQAILKAEKFMLTLQRGPSLHDFKSTALSIAYLRFY